MTAVITGGAGALGRVLAVRLAEQGHVVHLVDRSPAVHQVAEQVGGVAHVLDVTDDDQLLALGAIEEVDVLVNGVGAWPLITIDELTPARWRELLEVNLTSAFVVTQVLLPGLRRSRGAVVNLSSGIGLKGHPLLVHYAAAKAGLIGMTKALALALGPDGVRVNAVAPGLVSTPANRESWGAEAEAAFRAQRALDVDLHEADVVDAVAFLASPAARTITGQTLVVDGGTVLH
jgi:NAD(P)-dependent dehydrogenase (short-subunit alcohol dehydrogenase family)